MSLETAINAIPILLTIWAVFTACFVAILTYRGQLTRYEQECLFLTQGHASHLERQQSEIVKRVKQIEPLVRVLGVLTTIITVCIVTIWTLDAWKSLQS